MVFNFLCFIFVFIEQNPIAFGKDLFYDFEISYFSGSPDGVLKHNILGANYEFPGPLIEAYVGDILNVKVTNKIQDGSNTTVHWHGLFQNRTPFNDGPNQITQCPIPVGKTMLYSFPLTQSGTYWWHSHVTYQFTEGMWGPLIIHDEYEPYQSDYDCDLVITLNDWYHQSGKVNAAWFLSPISLGNEPIPDAGLINGHGSYPCSFAKLQNYTCNVKAQRPALFEVLRGKRYRMRLINTSALSSYNFSIDYHSLDVIEADGVPTRKVTVDVISIAPAQRYSFIVHMNGQENKYWMRCKILTDMFAEGININMYPQALITDVVGVLKYKSYTRSQHYRRQRYEEKKTIFPREAYYGNNEGFYVPVGSQNIRYLNEKDLAPYDGEFAPDYFDEEITTAITNVDDSQGVNHLTLDGIIFTPSNYPALVQFITGQQIPDSVHPFEIKFFKVYQIVLNNHDSGGHPFHLHGHVFHVCGKGEENDGDYDPAEDSGKLITNGVVRDTVTVLADSWVVIRFISNNPGVWLFHCHISWHLQSGLAGLFLEGESEARKVLTIPQEAKKICAYSGINI